MDLEIWPKDYAEATNIGWGLNHYYWHTHHVHWIVSKYVDLPCVLQNLVIEYLYDMDEFSLLSDEVLTEEDDDII